MKYLSDLTNWFSNNVLYIEITLLVVAVFLILLQNRGAGLSASFGGSNEVYLTRRGIEKSVVKLTVIAIIIFVLVRFVEFYL